MKVIGKVYTLSPDKIKFDDRYVVFNPLHNELEYEATKENIIRLGQLDPILILDGLCIGGRHRTRIAKELGVDVRCIDVDSSTSDEDIIVMCNKNVMSGRDYDNSQKAIQALSLVNTYSMSVINAAKLMKVDKRLVSFASTIKGFNRQDILDTLMKDKGNRVQLTNMERPSRSLEILAKYVKAETESHKIVVDDSERIQWKPDAHIKTEYGKAWYYEQLELVKMRGSIHVEQLLVELANLKYRVDCESEKVNLSKGTI